MLRAEARVWPGLLLVLLLGACGEEAPPAPEQGSGAAGSSVAGQERVRFFSVLREAQAAWKSGDAAVAEERFRAALALRPAHEQATLSLVEILLGDGRRAEAIGHLERLREADPQLPRTPSLLAGILLDPSPDWWPDPERAARMLEATIARHPADTGPHLRRARLHRLLGENEAAERIYRAVLVSNAGSLEARGGLAALLLARGAAAQAADTFLAALQAGMRATGRSDVPSEMDTASSFIARDASAPANVSNLFGLGRAAGLARAWPENATPDLRLPPAAMARLLPLEVGGRPAVRRAAAAIEVLVPGGAGALAPVLLMFRDGNFESTTLGGLLPAGSAAWLGADTVLLGGVTPADPEPLRVVTRAPDGSWSAQVVPGQRGLVLGSTSTSASAQGGTPGALVARAGDAAPALLALTPGSESAGATEPRSEILAEGVFLDALLDGQDVLVLNLQGEVLRCAAGKPATIVARAAGAVALALFDADGDTVADLWLARPAGAAAHLRALLGIRDGEPSILVCRGTGDGTFAPPEALPGARAWSVRAMRPLADGRVILACGDPEPGSHTPSLLLTRDAAGSWIPTPLHGDPERGDAAFDAVPLVDDVLLIGPAQWPGLQRPLRLSPLPP